MYQHLSVFGNLNEKIEKKVIGKKRIGIIVSGGDCSGLNATVRAIVHHSEKTFGWEVFGFMRGFWGIWTRPMQLVRLTSELCDQRWITSGGIFLGGNKSKDKPKMLDGGEAFSGLEEAFCDGYQKLELDAIIVIGGDGSFKCLNGINEIFKKSFGAESQKKINIIAIPKTIDNDVPYTDLAIGHETALEVVKDALDNLQMTAESHDRVMVAEVMGRDAGHIALKSGIAAGADVILIPEIRYDIQKVADHINNIYENWKRHALVVVAESVKTPCGSAKTSVIGNEQQRRYSGIGQAIAIELKDKIDADVRFSLLGHIQRGGAPRIKDRLIAARFGVFAVDLISRGEFDRVVVVENGRTTNRSLFDVTSAVNAVDPNGEMVHVAESLGIYVGEK